MTSLPPSIGALFRRWPALCGFTVQERASLTRERAIGLLAGELCLADVEVHTWPGMEAPPELCNEIARALLRLMDEHAEAEALLRGRTFARTLH